MKKILSLLLAVMMFASCIPAFADATWTITEDGALGIVSGVKLSGDVVIPEVVDGITVTSLATSAFNNQTDVTSIAMPNTIQALSGNAINFLDGVTSLKLSENLTVIEDMNGMLKGLTSLTVPASVRYIGDSFTSLQNLQSMTFEGVCPVFDSDDPLYGMSSSCVIYVPDDQVEAYKEALAGDYDIDDLVQPSGKTAVVYNCAAPEAEFAFDAATGTITGYTGAAAYLQIPATIGGAPVKAIGENAFAGNSSLFYAVIPEGVESIGNNAFQRCDSMLVVDFPTTLKKIGDNAFDGCYLEKVFWKEGLEEIGANAFSRYCIQSLRLPGTLKTIGDGAFKNGSITHLYMGKNIESIGAEAFANNYIQRIEMPVNRMIQINETAFAGNTSETYIYLGWDIPVSVYRDYEHLFMNIYEGYTYPYIQAPIKDPSLGLEYPADGTDSYNQDVWVSYNGNQPNLMTWYSWNRIPITTLGDGLFKGNQTIKSWYPCHEFTMHHIGAEAFADSSVEVVDLFHEIHTIGGHAFRNCVNIKEITLPETLTSIAANAFEGCTGLQKITILCDPSVIPQGLLDTCTALTEVSAGPNATAEQNQMLQFALHGMPEVTITQQPVGMAAGVGETVFASVQATGENLTYAWYINGAPVEGATGNALAVTMDPAYHGAQVYCVVTDAYGTAATSDTVTMTVASQVTILTQPMGAELLEGESASLSIAAEGQDLKYQWYINDAPIEGAVDTTCSVGMNAGLNGAQVHCVVTDAYGSSVASEKATLTLRQVAPLTITVQPCDVELPEGEMTNITVEATGDGLVYQWYVMPVSKSEFAAAEGFNTNVYSVPVDFDSDWSQVYCVITDAYGNSVTSETASIYIAEPELVIPEVAVDANYVGHWTSTKADADGMILDRTQLEQFGMVMDLALNEDGSASLIMFGEEDACTWGVANGFLYLISSEDVMEMTIPGDGTISYDGVIFEKGEAPSSDAAEMSEEEKMAALLGMLAAMEETEATEEIVEEPVEEEYSEDEMSDEEMLAFLAMMAEAMEEEETEASVEMPVEAPVEAPAASGNDAYVGTWKACYLSTGAMVGDPRSMFGLTVTLQLNADGTGAIDFPEATSGIWYPGEYGFMYFGQGGDNADMPMSLLDGGYLKYGTDLAGYIVFSQDESAVWTPEMDTAASAPVMPAAPVATPEPAPAAPAVSVGGAEDRLNKKFVAQTYTAFGQTMDASMLGAEYSMFFREDGTCDFGLAGMVIPNLPWGMGKVAVGLNEVDAFIINYYGTMFNAVLTETGFDMDYYGTMTLHFVPAE